MELLALTIAITIWADRCAGRFIRVSTDNLPTVHIVNSGRTRDVFMLKCLCHIAWISAKHQFMVKVVFVEGVNNTLPDCLSRWYCDMNARRKFKRETAGEKWIRRSVNEAHLKFLNVSDYRFDNI